mmetsp:Transcript_36491/g.104975  ORF Transcript_36491/g.104975 Transcript_36491/m.104975 type:complete len:201 (-) Transcript_36491:620-1222(-)
MPQTGPAEALDCAHFSTPSAPLCAALLPPAPSHCRACQHSTRSNSAARSLAAVAAPAPPAAVAAPTPLAASPFSSSSSSMPCLPHFRPAEAPDSLPSSSTLFADHQGQRHPPSMRLYLMLRWLLETPMTKKDSRMSMSDTAAISMVATVGTHPVTCCRDAPAANAAATSAPLKMARLTGTAVAPANEAAAAKVPECLHQP